MAQLRQDYDKFTAQDTVIVVVGPENGLAFSLYWSSNSLPFIGLPDPGHTVLKRYGQEVNPIKPDDSKDLFWWTFTGLTNFIITGEHE